MDAGKSTISGVFNGSRLLEIPFYQRAYVWGEEQWGRFDRVPNVGVRAVSLERQETVIA